MVRLPFLSRTLIIPPEDRGRDELGSYWFLPHGVGEVAERSEVGGGLPILSRTSISPPRSTGVVGHLREVRGSERSCTCVRTVSSIDVGHRADVRTPILERV